MKNYHFYKNLSKIRKNNIDEFFTKWKKFEPEDIQIIDNLLNEHFLDEKHLISVYDLFTNSKSKSYKDIKYELVSLAKKNCLEGKEIKYKTKNIFLGTVITKSSFEDHLRRNYFSRFRSVAEIKKFIRHLHEDDGKIPSIYHDITIKKMNKIVWFTWDNKNNSTNPFYFLSSANAEEARTALGLGHIKNEKCLALIFSMPINKLYRPTFFDSDCNQYFRPTPLRFDKYGIIHPLNGGKYNIEHSVKVLDTLAKELPETVSDSSNYKVKNLVKCNLLI